MKVHSKNPYPYSQPNPSLIFQWKDLLKEAENKLGGSKSAILEENEQLRVETNQLGRELAQRVRELTEAQSKLRGVSELEKELRFVAIGTLSSQIVTLTLNLYWQAC